MTADWTDQFVMLDLVPTDLARAAGMADPGAGSLRADVLDELWSDCSNSAVRVEGWFREHMLAESVKTGQDDMLHDAVYNEVQGALAKWLVRLGLATLKTEEAK